MRQITVTASFVIDYDPSEEQPEDALHRWLADNNPVELFDITDDQEVDNEVL